MYLSFIRRYPITQILCLLRCLAASNNKESHKTFRLTIFSPASLIFLDCSTLQCRPIFASLYRVIFEKDKYFRSISLSVCFKYYKVWHVQFCGSSVHSTNKVLTEYKDEYYSVHGAWRLIPYLSVLRGGNIIQKWIFYNEGRHVYHSWQQ